MYSSTTTYHLAKYNMVKSTKYYETFTQIDRNIDGIAYTQLFAA